MLLHAKFWKDAEPVPHIEVLHDALINAHRFFTNVGTVSFYGKTE